eukprot:gene37744-61104_t
MQADKFTAVLRSMVITTQGLGAQFDIQKYYGVGWLEALRVGWVDGIKGVRRLLDCYAYAQTILMGAEMRQKIKCGAYARSTGNPCQAKALPNGKCRLHGGLSRGATTPEGRQAIAQATVVTPCQLEVRMDVDEAGCDEQPA